MKHLTIGGSTAERTKACPGWVSASKDIPTRPAGQAAIDGSMHHEVQEMCQRDGAEPKDHVGFVYSENGVSREFTEDDLALSYMAFNATNALCDELDIDEMIVEPFVQLIPDLAGGSIDLIGLSRKRDTLLFLDYKFGRGKVGVKNNVQLQFYGISAEADPLTADMFDGVDNIEFAIIQPQVSPEASRWSCTPAELAEFKIDMMTSIDQAQSSTPPLNTGSHCQYCPASPYCTVRRADMIGTLNLGLLAKDALQASADILEDVEAWLNAAKQELYIQLSRGVNIHGWKIVDKRASRKWIDEAAAEEALILAKIDRGIFTKEILLTAPQVVDALKKYKIDFNLSEFIEVKSSGTTLVAEHDDRDAVVPGVPENLKKLMAAKK